MKLEIFQISDSQYEFHWKVTEDIEDQLLISMLSALRILAMTDEDIEDKEQVLNLTQ